MDADPLSNTVPPDPDPQTEQEEEEKKKKKQKLKEPPPTPSPSPNTASASSSPSHEFSFTISLHSSNSTCNSNSAVTLPDRSCKTPNNSFAIDLSPADEIFFHGHLLPLHLLNHLSQTSVSPRSSTNSLDSFTLPIKDLIHDDHNKISGSHDRADVVPPRKNNSPIHVRTTKKSKSFSIFGWRKPGERDEPTRIASPTRKKKQKRKLSQLVKRYVEMVKKPLLSFKQQKRGTDRDIEIQFGRQSAYSFSGHLNNSFSKERSSNSIKKQELFSSAPASMRTSPTNSGLLVPTPTLHSNDNSTMEELQAAIQAAIAHCKNSIAMAEGGKLVKTA